MNSKYESSTFIKLAALVLSICGMAYGDFFEECDDTVERNFIESSKGCNFYIFCDGMNSFDGDCGDDLYFNKEFQTCDPKDQVECRLDSIVQTTTTINPFQTPTQTVTGLGSTTDLASTVSKFSSSFATAKPPITSATTMTMNPSEITSTSILSTISVNISPPYTPECPDVDYSYQMVFMADQKSCSDYFMCYYGKALHMHCSGNLQFNSAIGKCDYPENVHCKANYSLPKDQCKSYTVDVYPHSSNCNYFYSCRNGYLMVEQCPISYGWDVERRSCLPRKQSKCYNN